MRCNCAVRDLLILFNLKATGLERTTPGWKAQDLPILVRICFTFQKLGKKMLSFSLAPIKEFRFLDQESYQGLILLKVNNLPRRVNVNLGKTVAEFAKRKHF